MKVKVYSTEFCGWCHKAKDWLKENKVEFEAVDVSEDEEAQKEMVDKSGQMGVPVIIVTTDEGTEEVIVGFDQAKLKELLKL